MTAAGPLLFNPLQATTEELEQTFVARLPLLERLQNSVIFDAVGPTRRHWIIVGPRGSGKSHLVELLCRKLHRNQGWLIARLPEEHYQISTLGELLEQVALEWGGDRRRLQDITDESRLVEAALGEIQAVQQRSKKHGLVVVENLASLLDSKFSPKEQSRLREILMNDPPFILVTTSTRYFRSIVRESAPFYDFFQRISLEDFGPDEVFRLIESRARWHHSEELLANLEGIRARVHAIHHLSGGNPRLALALYAVLKTGVASDIHQQVMRLLDEETPYYQAQLAELSPQARRVLAAIALADGPPTPAELGRRCRIGTSQITAVLNRLQSEQLVQMGPRLNTRGRSVVLSDRFLRIWLQMREDPTSRARIRWLSEFFRAWYEGSEELHDSAQRLSRAFWDRLPYEDSACRGALETILHLQDALRSTDPIAADWLARTALEREFPKVPGISLLVSRLEKLLTEVDEAGSRDAITYALVVAYKRQGLPERVISLLRPALDGAEPPYWMWDRFRMACIAALGQSDAHEQLRTLATQYPNKDFFFQAQIGLDAIHLNKAAEGHSILSRVLPQISCDHCRIELYGEWARAAIRHRATDRVPEIVASAEETCSATSVELLKAFVAIEKRQQMDPTNVITICEKYVASINYTPPSWIQRLLLSSVQQSTAMRTVTLFEQLSVRLSSWHRLLLLVAEYPSRMMLVAVDRFLNAGGPPAKALEGFVDVSISMIRAKRSTARGVLAVYKALREQGAGEPIPHFEQALRVVNAENRTDVLESLEPQIREAVELLLGSSSSTVAVTKPISDHFGSVEARGERGGGTEGRR